MLHNLLHILLHNGDSNVAVFKRGSTYQLRRRVPKRYRSVEPRATVWASLHTDSESVAKRKAEEAWAHLVEAWEAKLSGCSEEALERYEAARELANIRGFRYLDVNKVSALPVEELIERISKIETPSGEPDVIEAAAVLGTAEEPRLTIEGALELYWTLAREKTLGKSPDQLRRWKNPRIKAIRNFVSVVGNKPIESITRDDMLDFRQYWLERIESEGLTPNSANKDLIHVGGVLKTIVKMKRLDVDLPLGDLAFREGEKQVRPPFSDNWIKSKILRKGALTRLNDQARGLLLGMVNTGYRPSEGSALNANTIRLDVDIPHISIEPDGRQLKTPHARRIIPLTGVSLEAFKGFRDGFSRYKNKPTASATINKYLRTNGLLETPQHSLYSLRHAFEDRMLAAGIDERIRRDVFGHSLNRERYGRGASLEHVARLMKQIAL